RGELRRLVQYAEAHSDPRTEVIARPGAGLVPRQLRQPATGGRGAGGVADLTVDVGVTQAELQRLADLAGKAELDTFRAGTAGQHHEAGVGRVGRLGVRAIEAEHRGGRQQLRTDRPLDPCLEVAELL